MVCLIRLEAPDVRHQSGGSGDLSWGAVGTPTGSGCVERRGGTSGPGCANVYQWEGKLMQGRRAWAPGVKWAKAV